MLTSLTSLAALWGFIQGLIMALFIISGLLLTLVVLMQEGKGGGIAGAFGGAGAEAFGVKAGTINRFTAYVGTAFLGLALLYASFSGLANATPDLERRSVLSDDLMHPVIEVDKDQKPATPPVEKAPGEPAAPPAGGAVPPGGPTPPGGSTPPGTPPDGSKPPTPPAEPPKEPAPAPAPVPEQPKEPAPVPPAMGG